MRGLPMRVPVKRLMGIAVKLASYGPARLLEACGYIPTRVLRRAYVYVYVYVGT